jgi:hypothetical protein
MGAGHELRRFDLCSREIAGCRECYGCWRSPGGGCVVRDDFQKFFAGLQWAQAVLWCFPLFWFGMPAQDKAALDRLFSILYPHIRMEDGACRHPQWFTPPPMVMISTCGYAGTACNYEGFRRQMLLASSALGPVSMFCVPESGYLRLPRFEDRAAPVRARLFAAGAEFAAAGRLSALSEDALSARWLPPELFLSVHNAWSDHLSGPLPENLRF